MSDQVPDITPQHDAISEEMATDVARMIGALSTKYAKKPRILALALTRNLGAFIAVLTNKPKEGLEKAAKVLLATPYEEIRSEYFGFELGITDVDNAIKPADIGDVYHLGIDPRSKRT